MFIRSNFTEAEIIKGCLKGDRKAQQHLYEHYSGKFLAICLRYIKDRDMAEDAMIGGFMRIFQKLPQYEAKGSFEGWMKRVIVTEALTALRKNKNLAMEVGIDVREEMLACHDGHNDLEAAELMELIRGLPLGYRTVFNLYAIEGYGHAEIGKLLGISESTSKSQLNRARNLLKQKLAVQQLNEGNTNG